MIDHSETKYGHTHMKHDSVAHLDTVIDAYLGKMVKKVMEFHPGNDDMSDDERKLVVMSVLVNRMFERVMVANPTGGMSVSSEVSKFALCIMLDMHETNELAAKRN